MIASTKRHKYPDDQRDLVMAERLQARAVRLEAQAQGMQEEADVLKTAARRILALAGLPRRPPKRH